jgi:hypothetical protein
MRKAIVIAAILAATSAQASNILSIARYSNYTISLSDMTCPHATWKKVAVFVSYDNSAPGNAHGCYSDLGGTVSINWFRNNTGHRLPESVQRDDFVSATD